MLHERRYGHELDEEIELVNLHLSVYAPSVMPPLPEIGQGSVAPVGEQIIHGISRGVPVYERLSIGSKQTLRGPVILIEPSATTWVKPGWQVAVNRQGSLLLERR